MKNLLPGVYSIRRHGSTIGELSIKADTNTANQITASQTLANEGIRLSSVRMFMRI